MRLDVCEDQRAAESAQVSHNFLFSSASWVFLIDTLQLEGGGGNMVDEVNLGAAEGAQDVVKIKELRKALKSLLRIKAEGASSSFFFCFLASWVFLIRYTPT
ncbi:hypothetical protein AtEden1_Chr2g0232671 [Arabidopsis thaliana]